MAKTKGPLFSYNAWGDLGKALRYQGRGGTNYVKKLNNKPATASPAQLSWRKHYKNVWNSWDDLSPIIKWGWAYLADLLGYWSARHLYFFYTI